MSDFIRGQYLGNGKLQECDDPLAAGLDSGPDHRPEEMPAAPWWRVRVATYWRARGIVLAWARRAQSRADHHPDKWGISSSPIVTANKNPERQGIHGDDRVTMGDNPRGLGDDGVTMDRPPETPVTRGGGDAVTMDDDLFPHFDGFHRTGWGPYRDRY